MEMPTKNNEKKYGVSTNTQVQDAKVEVVSKILEKTMTKPMTSFEKDETRNY